MFAQMCETILLALTQSDSQDITKDVEMFQRDLLPHLLVLATDKVANIRQRAGICLQVCVCVRV
jgi:hypothetical protein